MATLTNPRNCPNQSPLHSMGNHRCGPSEDGHHNHYATKLAKQFAHMNFDERIQSSPSMVKCPQIIIIDDLESTHNATFDHHNSNPPPNGNLIVPVLVPDRLQEMKRPPPLSSSARSSA